MSQQSGGSFTRAAADLISSDPLVREQAVRQAWVRFEPRLLELIRRRLNPGTRVPADEDEIVRAVCERFLAIGQDGDRAFPADREELWRLLVWMAMCKIAHSERTLQALRRDVRRMDPAVESPEISWPKLIGWMAELDDQNGLSPQKAAVARKEFDRLLGKLPAQLQQIFVWKLQGHTNAEISRLITRTERTVELKLQIIRKTLEQDLKIRTCSGAE